MRRIFMAIFAVAFIVVVCGCPKTAPPRKPSATKLIDTYKGDGNQKVTIVYFKNARCPIKTLEILRGVENLSEGSVYLMEVDGDVDRAGKDAYSVRAYPTILFFDATGDLKERKEGPNITMDEGKQIVVGLGASIKGMESETPEAPEPPDVDEGGPEVPETPETPEAPGDGG